MAREQNISESVNFEQISVNIVPPQSSHWEVPVVLQVCNLLRVAEVDQSRLRQLEAEIFILKAREGGEERNWELFSGQTSSALYSARV